MKHRKTLWMAVGFAVLVGLIGAAPGLAQNEIFIPLLVYRTGPYAPNGIPIFNGYSDYLKLLNARDGGGHILAIRSHVLDRRSAYLTRNPG